MVKEPIVIVGGGRAAARVIEGYREEGGDALITVLAGEVHPPYNRPPLSKGVLRGEMEVDASHVHPVEWYDDMAVELRLGTVAASVDASTREVVLDDGERVPYGTLVIASGTHPRALSVPGAELPAVHVYRTIDDALAVSKEAATARKALVVGGSFIGSEVAASLRALGLEVTLVEAGPRLTPALRSDALSEQIVQLFREHGVEVVLNESIQEFRANQQVLTGALTASGRQIEAFLAVVGVGVQPNTGFLESSGITLDDGVVVDEMFHASYDDVYAVGDVAHFNDVVAGRSRRVEHWGNADKQGVLLGRNLAGKRGRFTEVSAFFTKLFDLELQVYGDLDGVDDLVLRGSVADRRLLGFYLREGHLAGAVLAGQTADVAEELKTLIAERPVAPEHARLADESLRPAAVFA